MIFRKKVKISDFKNAIVASVIDCNKHKMMYYCVDDGEIEEGFYIHELMNDNFHLVKRYRISEAEAKDFLKSKTLKVETLV